MATHPHAGDFASGASGAPPAGRRRSPSALGAIALGFVRAHVIALSVIVGLVLLYTLVGFFVVPRIARSQIESYVTGTLHKKVSIGDIRFNPFALDASIAGLKLTEPDGSPIVSFRHLYVNATLASLWHRGLVLEEVELSAPDVQVVVARDGSVNLVKLIPESTEPPAAQDEPPPRVRIGRLAVTEGRIGIEDHTRPRVFTAAAQPIRFTLHDFRTDIGYDNLYNFSGTTTSGEELDWRGAFTVKPLGSNGRFDVRGLKLKTVDSYLQDSLPFRIAGDATLLGTYVFKLDPLALDVTLPTIAVRNATLADRAGNAAAPVTFPELDLHQLVFSYAKRDVGLQSIDVKGARVDVALEADGTLSLDRLFGIAATEGGDADAGASAAAADSTPSSGSSSSSASSESDWKVHADTIKVENATVMAEDRTVTPAPRFELTPVNVTISGWSTDPQAKLELDADVTINKSGRLTSSGEVQLEPLSTTLKVDLADFDLPIMQPYLEQTTALNLHSGKLSAKGGVAYGGRLVEAPPLKFEGDVKVADLRTTDRLVNEDFIKWRSLAVTGISYQQQPDRLTIERIVARQPYAKVVIAKNQTLNVAQVLSPGTSPEGAAPAAEPGEKSGDRKADDKKSDEKKAEKKADKKAATTESSKPPAESGPTMPIRIRSVQILDGSANFADYSIEPSFATGILELNGKVTGLSSEPDSRAQVALQGKVDKYAPVDITGEANILSPTKYAALAMDFRNMELTTFNPYSGKFAGYNISRGKLSTELRYRVEDRKLQAEHHIVVDNLEFGAKTDSKDAAPIPIKLAVALLKDRNGVIDVNLPVSGTIDDPKFRLGPIIWKAILGLLTKIVTAPFAALGALFGGGDELAYVDFAPGSAELAPAETEKLNKLSKALVERPQLKLNVPLTVTGAQDGAVLAQRALAAQMPAGLSEPAGDEAEQRKRVTAMEGVYKTVMKAAPEYPPEIMPQEKGQKPDPQAQLDYLQRTMLEQMQPDQAALDALAQQRARAVQDALLANTALTPERVFITSERSEGKTTRSESKEEGAAPDEGAASEGKAEGAPAAEQVRMEMKLE